MREHHQQNLQVRKRSAELLAKSSLRLHISYARPPLTLWHIPATTCQSCGLMSLPPPMLHAGRLALFVVSLLMRLFAREEASALREEADSEQKFVANESRRSSRAESSGLCSVDERVSEFNQNILHQRRSSDDCECEPAPKRRRNENHNQNAIKTSKSHRPQVHSITLHTNFPRKQAKLTPSRPINVIIPS